MNFWAKLFGQVLAPRAATQEMGGGRYIVSPEDLEEALRGGGESASGAVVNENSALCVAAVYACVRIISGAIATLPLNIKRRVDNKTREDASGTPIWRLMRRKPNRWQTPSQFKRMMQAHVLIRGNAYALKRLAAKGEVRELLPLHPDRVECKQGDDLALTYVYTRRDGQQVTFKQEQIFHLVGLTLDGVTGVSVIKYARETIGLSLTMENHGAKMFKRGARVSGVLKHPGKIGPEGTASLRESIDAFHSDGEDAGGTLVIEEGMSYERMALTAEDAQWLESRKFSRTDIAMFFGVPPHMIGDTEKSTSWGSGIEQQSIGFVAYTLEDHLTMWEETTARDVIVDEDSDLYAKFNRAALIKGDIKASWDAYTRGLQWGVFSPNEIRALNDMNPREGGDVYYEPPNTAGTSGGESKDEPPQAS